MQPQSDALPIASPRSDAGGVSGPAPVMIGASIWSSFFRSFGEGVVSLLFPPHCELCERPMERSDFPVCAPCMNTFRLVGDNSCRRCGATLGPNIGVIHGCPHCEKWPDGLGASEIIAAGLYDEAMRRLVHRLKYQRRLALANIAANWLTQLVFDRGVEADVVTAIPSTRRRFQLRGFNQAEEIAKRLARNLNLPFSGKLIRRIRDSAPQARVRSSAERSGNVRGAFVPRRGAAAHGKRVLLVDDVLTTGATAREAIKALRKADVGKVAVAVVARAT